MVEKKKTERASGGSFRAFHWSFNGEPASGCSDACRLKLTNRSGFMTGPSTKWPLPFRVFWRMQADRNEEKCYWLTSCKTGNDE